VVSPETPGTAGASSYYGNESGPVGYEENSYADYGPAQRGLLRRRGVLAGGAAGGLLAGLPSGWTEFDVLAWWHKGRQIQPLLNTSPTGTPIGDAAVIGTTGTTALFGNDKYGEDIRAGGRVNLGLWLDGDSSIGIGNRLTSVAGDDITYDNQSNGTEILGRPFFNVLLNDRDALLLSYPGEFSGEFHATSSTNFIMNDFYARLRMSEDAVNRIDFLIGYEYARIGDDLIVRSSTTNINALDPAFGVTFDFRDEFRTVNKFDGVMIGLMGDYVRGRAKVSYLGKLGYGNLDERLIINGTGSASAGGASVPLNGGLLALPTNSGTHSWSRPVFVPEVNLNLHLQLTQRLDFSIGYSFVYFTNVLLAGDQVDRRLNLSQQSGALTGQAFPLPQRNETDFWYQGLNFGLNGTF
jgi:hypothetical protein